jgi:hypothetical protein
MGLTVAVPLKELEDLDQEQRRVYLQSLAEQMQPALRRAAGGLDPQGPVSVRLHDSEDHPIMGQIMAVTIAAPFDADALPADCEFYAAYNGGRGGVHQADQGPLIAGGGPVGP